MTTERVTTERKTGVRRSTPSWWTHWAGGTALLIGLWCAVLLLLQAAIADFDTALFSLAVLFGLCVVWLAYTLIGLIRYRAFLISLIAPILVLGWIVVAKSGAVEAAAWRISQGPMEDAAANCADAEGGLYGIYFVHSVAEQDGGCLFTTDNDVDRAGYAYLPGGVPARPRVSYFPLDGPWHTFIIYS
ncbi:hypothetical protein AB0H00_11430 [Nocardia sp. NPDC023852]|uniref:hypothetical protein n=1 Tax=Nocardia sp. NPDC023852 TaxID=3154697 RepID=UPI0033CD5E1B